MGIMALQEAIPFEKRCAESKRIVAKYPDRIPVICEKSARSNLPDIDKKKFLVPGTMLCGEFKYIVHKHLTQMGTTAIASDQTIYLFVNRTSPKTGALMSEVYSTGLMMVSCTSSTVRRTHWGQDDMDFLAD